MNLSDELQKIICCPNCRDSSLVIQNNSLECKRCNIEFLEIDKIPRLFIEQNEFVGLNKVTPKVREFYEGTPFPNYDEFDSVASLIDKASQGVFAKLLNEQLPYQMPILEVGCGTGQLTNFLSTSNRTAIGVDMSLNSLRLGQAFKENFKLPRSHFFQMNLFFPIFKDESFPVVISNGVLHHTYSTKKAFESIARLVKPGGYIIIGLYHKFGRILTDLRRIGFNVLGNQHTFMDPRLKENVDQNIRHAWFMDQYKNPHETKHTVSEVMQWFKEFGFSFINSIPKTVLGQEFSPKEELFIPQKPGGTFERSIAEFLNLFLHSNEGGFFTVIGKKGKKIDK
jgi:ubiquinone/menaquinone biosynthesis C-methylase UbiE/uncharacterized protein YbaR (Trm112 family)